ncbi:MULTISPECIES: type II toxin-antitoxin system HigB family toxin [Bartonella]|uniref:Type II toxin-antitoxin system HigB family toxin n=1 Tax=Bartonella harrusi TaxID=2961895 RepID=A0ABY5EVE1_9HYPH|nr:MULTISPECIES: type II toxin-antitoxin system HigB family toxin [Bartonella]UNE54632.1 type II toxin-antitoxin system HigB family toxin [Bartonella machadoae]UTO29187.1 type II toxin-antitoxin system HigB family toxin [Bartonella harrusi]
MKIVKISTLQIFWDKYPDAEQPLKAWIDEAKNAQWRSPHDIKEKYKNASILKNNRVVFNIRGNDYRLIVSIFYPAGWLYIKFIGTHKQYDAIDANTVELKEFKK